MSNLHRDESGKPEQKRADIDESQQPQDKHTGQIDDNQDDLGRDVNNPGKTSNDINKQR